MSEVEDELVDRRPFLADPPRKLRRELLDRVVRLSMQRLGRLSGVFPRNLNYRDAIRRKCIDCCAGSISEVRLCETIACPLWPFRMGEQPFRRSREKKDADDDDE